MVFLLLIKLPYQRNARLVDAPVVLVGAALADADAVRHGVLVVFGTGVTGGGVEIEPQGTVQWQHIAARDTTALIVSLLARIARLVVELARVVHGSQESPFLLTYIIAQFRRHFPEGVAAVLVVPAPRSPRTAYKDADVAVDAPFDAEVGGEGGPAEEVEAEAEAA